MAGQAQATQQQPASKPASVPSDGKQRIFLYVAEGDEQKERALDYLRERYPDPPDSDDPDYVPPIKKVGELRLDRLNHRHIVIPIVWDINRDRKIKTRIASTVQGVPDQLVDDERKGDIKEGKPVDVAKFYHRATSQESEDSFDENGFINALGMACIVGGNVLACPRVQRRGDGKGNHVHWIVLRLG